MTIKDTVRRAIVHMPGNKWFSAGKIIAQMHDIPLNTYKPSQIMRAIRDLLYVQKDGKGNYRVRGRKVPVL